MMESILVKPRHRPGRLAATRAALPAIMVLPVRAHADPLFPQHQTDGISRNLIDAFARFSDLLVIAPSTALQYRGPAVEARQLNRELGIDYIVSVHLVRNDDALTLTHELLDAHSGVRVWRDSVPTLLGRFYEFERDVVSRVINRVLPSVREAEILRAFRKPPSVATAYDLTMQALPLIEALSRGALDRADALLRTARALDPTYAPAFAWGARTASLRIGQDWMSNRAATAEEAAALASQAIALDPEDHIALATAGHLRSYLRQNYGDGLSLIERAIAACPNSAYAWSMASPTLCYMGRAQEAREHAEHAIWLSPLDPFLFQFNGYAGLSCYMQGEYDAAVSKLRLSLLENPNYTATLKYLMASLVGLGEVQQARALAERLVQLEPDFGKNGIIRCPFNDPIGRALFRTHMRTAGF